MWDEGGTWKAKRARYTIRVRLRSPESGPVDGRVRSSSLFSIFLHFIHRSSLIDSNTFLDDCFSFLFPGAKNLTFSLYSTPASRATVNRNGERGDLIANQIASSS